DLRCVRSAAAVGAAGRRGGDVPLPVWVHGAGGGYGERGDGPGGDLQHLLRGAVLAAAPGAIRRTAGGEVAAARLQGVAGQHRLDGGRGRWRWDANPAGVHASDGAG